MAGRVLKRIARENVNVSLTLPASLLPFNREFAPRSATQSVEKSDSVTPPLVSFGTLSSPEHRRKRWWEVIKRHLISLVLQ